MGQWVFEEGELRLRRMEDSDADYRRLARWLSDPRVLAYYGGRDDPQSYEQVREKYAPRVLSADRVVPCIMEYAGRAVGYLQYYPADAVEYQFGEPGRLYAVDLFLGEPDEWGRGLGTRFLHRLLIFLFHELGAEWVLIDPHVDNPRAVRAYEKAGFRKVKILPRHEMHEGRLRDSWLMAARWDSFQEE
jgi:aminoglycoside 6'-N-acetyltransferase